ncbi:MAG: ATP-binding cassette domain-containing protein [Flavobacteriales bacterium]|nr:ATP-binding cassette domain-containing protein [Flavobacteriales bacterium]
MIDIALGLIEPNNGSILIDGVPFNKINQTTWRKATSYVPQDAFLLDDSIKQNLLWANPNASDEAMKSALIAAAAEGFTSKLPQGIDTQIGSKGVRISGGERQRLSIAMALVRKPQFLILDEATNAIDQTNEKTIYANIQQLNLTVLLISHDKETLLQADSVYKLKNGVIN